MGRLISDQSLAGVQGVALVAQDSQVSQLRGRRRQPGAKPIRITCARAPLMVATTAPTRSSPTTATTASTRADGGNQAGDPEHRRRAHLRRCLLGRDEHDMAAHPAIAR